MTYAVQQIQFKLQEKNKLLEQAVQRGSVALEQQEEELNRGAIFRLGCCRNRCRNMPIWSWQERGSRRGQLAGIISMWCNWMKTASEFV